MKLTIIGGASAYTPDIIAGLLREREAFAACELVLHDIDPVHLRIIERLTEAMTRAAGVDWQVVSTLDRACALTGAHFVLTQPRVGGLQGRSLDERIGLSHGVIGQETLGAGGFSFAWRTIPMILQIVQEVQKLAPKAWIINYANPAGMVTSAVLRRFPTARFIGLCDMPTGLQGAIACLLRKPSQRVSLQYAGMNHAGWCHQVLLDDIDILPRLRHLIRFLGPIAAMLPPSEKTGTMKLLHAYGLVADPYLRYYYETPRVLARLLRQRRTRAEILMERIAKLYRHYEVVGMAKNPTLRMHRGHSSHADLASQVIATMAAGRRGRFVIQQRNGGAVPDLPADEVAQFPVWIEGESIQPIAQPRLPGALAGLIQQIHASESHNVTAALQGDRLAAVEALSENPLVGRPALAETLVEEFLAAHRPFLPQFFG